MDYESFLNSKAQLAGDYGFKPTFIPDVLFDFQKHLVEWAVMKGRSAILADCGLGKTIMALAIAQNWVEKTNEPVLIATPLSVGHQFVSDGEKFGIECKTSRDGSIKSKITVTNYERLHLFDRHKFAGFIGDESSILKNFKGVTKSAVTEFMREMRYRLLCSATAAPNDYIELGTSSEALGHLGYIDMLKMFFKSDNNSYAQGGSGNGMKRFDKNPFGGKFRFRGHAERDFWRWVCSWARAVRKPSDLGFSDEGYILPELITIQHIVESNTIPDGCLFAMEAHGWKEQRAETKRTLKERCEQAAKLASERNGASVLWCNLNPEGDLLEKIIPGAVQVSGSDSLEKKEEALEGFRLGHFDKLITKAEIAGFGSNWQHCAHQTYFPTHSFEQWYQCIRRSWRFGQKNAVTIDVVTSEGEASILKNLQRKAAAAEKMFSSLVELMNNELKIQKTDNYKQKVEIPTWL